MYTAPPRTFAENGPAQTAAFTVFLNVIWAISSDTQSAYFCIVSSSNPTWVIYENTISNEIEIAV